MKRFLLALPLLAMGGLARAVTNGAVAISSGNAFYNVDVSSMSNGFVRQNMVIGDPNTVSQLAPVDAVGGLSVRLTTSTASNIGSIGNSSFAISTGGVSASQSGIWTVNVATGGVNITGSITNTSFVATQPNAYNVVSTSTLLGAGTAAIGSVAVDRKSVV